jgi:ParB family transcriptional regulator, chromosome partitioning protein
MDVDDMPAETTEAETTSGTVTLECRTLVRTYAHLRVRDRSAEARLLTSLSEVGQTSPILVARDATQRPVVIDGYRRVYALERLGHDTVTAVVLALPEVEALVYCHRLQTGRRRSAVEEGWLLRELCGQHPNLRDLGRALGHSHSWVSRRLSLVGVLPERVEEAVRRGLLPADSAMKSLVPLARKNSVQCEQLVENLGGERVTTRQVAQLYKAWRAGDEEQKERIVQAPRLFLRAVEASMPAAVGDELGGLLRELDALGEALGHAHESLCRTLAVELAVTHTARVRRAFGPVVTAWETLRSKMEELDAGPRHADGDLAAAR